MPQLRLKAAHTHAGVVYPPGHVIDVDDVTARWLTQYDIAMPADAAVNAPQQRGSTRRCLPLPNPSTPSTPKE